MRFLLGGEVPAGGKGGAEPLPYRGWGEVDAEGRRRGGGGLRGAEDYNSITSVDGCLRRSRACVIIRQDYPAHMGVTEE